MTNIDTGSLHGLSSGRAGFALTLLAAFLAGCTAPEITTHRPAIGSPDHHEAESDEPALSLEQRRANILMASARTQEADQAWDQAAETYRKILAANPDHLEASRRLAVLHCRAGRVGEAEPLFLRCLALAPVDAQLRCDAGYFYYLQGRWEQADQHLREALQIDPNLAAAHMNLGLLHARLGRTDEALTEFSLAGCSAAEAKVNVAFAAMINEDWDRALGVYEEALSEQPGLEKAVTGIATARKMKHRDQTLRLAANQPAGAAPPPQGPEFSVQPAAGAANGWR